MGGITMATVAAISAVTSVVSLAISLSMRPDGPKDNGVSVDRKGHDNPKIVAFGNCLVPAVRVWQNVHNQNTRWLSQAYSLGVGELKDINQVYIDGVPYISGFQPNRWYHIDTSREFENLAVGSRLGKSTETPYPQLVQHSDGEWDSNCRGDMTASLGMMVWRRLPDDGDDDSNIRIMADQFKVEALVQGNRVIDPRVDPDLSGITNLDERIWGGNTSAEVYRNPACVLLTYLVDKYYGMAIPSDAIDVQSFINLANYCELNEIFFDGYIDQNQSFGDILKDMVTSFDGVVYVEDGLVRVKADRLTIPTVAIEEEDCVGSFKLSNSNDSSYYNIVNVEYVNTRTYHSKDKYVLPVDVTPVHQKDGFEKVKDIKLPFTAEDSGKFFVRHVANKALKRADKQRTIEFELDNTKKKLGIWNVFTINNDAYKLKDAVFRVDKVVTSLDDKTMISKITATQYEKSVYDGSDYEDGNTSNPLPPPSNQILGHVSLEFTQMSYAPSTLGVGQLSWTARYMREHKTIIEYKVSSATSWERVGEFQKGSYVFTGLKPDVHDFRVRVQTFAGSTSDWSYLKNIQVTSDLVIPNVTGLEASFPSEDCTVKWDDMENMFIGDTGETYADVFSHYEVQVYKGADEQYVSTHNVKGHKFVYTFDMNASEDVVNRRLHFKVLMVSKEGTKSQETADVSAHNIQCPQPTGVVIRGALTNLFAAWDMSSDLDYAGSEIHVSKDPVFTPDGTTIVGVSSGGAYQIPLLEAGNYYLRVGHFDMFGTDDMAYSGAIFFTFRSIDDVLTDTESWSELGTEIGSMKEDIVANAGEIQKHESSLGNQQAQITENKQTIASTVGNLSELEQTVTSNYGDLSSKVNTNKTSISNAEKSIGSLSQTVSANFGELSGAIENTNQVVAGVDGKVEAITQIKHDVNGKVSGLIMGNDGETSTFDVIADKFRVAGEAGAEAVFQIDTDTGEVAIRNALIKNLSADVIDGGTISGTDIKCTTKISAGQGDYSATLDGQDANWRIYSGNENPANAPFRVNKLGKLFSTNADIQGTIRANQLIFVGEVPDEINNDNVTAGSIGAATTGQLAQVTTTANSAVNTANALNNKIYPNQSKLQIKSANYLSGHSGWAIDSNGQCEFNDGVFRGTVKAENIIGDLVSAKAVSAVNGSVGVSGSWRQFNTQPLQVRNNTGSRATVTFEGGVVRFRATHGNTNDSIEYSSTYGWRLLKDGVEVSGQTVTANVNADLMGGAMREGDYSYTLNCPTFVDTLSSGDTSTHTYEVQYYVSGAGSRTSRYGYVYGSVVGKIFRDGGAWL